MKMLVEALEIFGLIISVITNTGSGASDTTFPTHPYVEYIQGNTNLIISVPHDGRVELPNIPERKPGCKDDAGKCQFGDKIQTDKCKAKNVCKVILGSDLNASVIARFVFNKFIEITGKTPSLIISHLHRSRLDPNRPVEEAAQGNEEATNSYEAFHSAIKHAHESLNGKPGLHFDFHGYTDTKRQNNTMIGYLFTKGELNDRKYSQRRSSVSALLERTNLTAEEILFGETSLGAMFERSGYKAIPSPRQPKPGDDKYYRGGWITQIHGSRDGGKIDAIQLEFPTEIRTEVSEEKRNKFSDELAHNIVMFYKLYYDM